jgi:hypothetical protein
VAQPLLAVREPEGKKLNSANDDKDVEIFANRLFPADSLSFTTFVRAPTTLTLLDATLTNNLTSVDSKQLTTNLNPSESTLTKNAGGGMRYG